MRPELSKSYSWKSGKTFPMPDPVAKPPERSHDDLDLLFEPKMSLTLSASTSMPNLADLDAVVVPDVQFWQELDLRFDSFDQFGLNEQSPSKSRRMEPLGVAGIPFGSSNSGIKKRPPKVDKSHFYHNPSKDGVASGTSTSMSRENSGSATKSSSSSSGMSMSISSASHAKMDISSASISESLNLNNSSMSMSIDSRDTMAHLARKIEPVMHDNIEFAPLDMTPGEELNLRRSSSFSMSTDERLIKYTSASTTTTPSVQKTFDFNPESVSMSMSSWSQHTIPHDVFSHHNFVQDSSFSENPGDSEIWPVPSDDLSLLGSLDSYTAGPSLQLAHNPSTNNNQQNYAHGAKNHLPPAHGQSNNNINNNNNPIRGNNNSNANQNTSHGAPSVPAGVAQQLKNTQQRQSAPPAAPPAPKASPKARAPRGPVRGRGNLKINVEKSAHSEKPGAKEPSPVLAPRSLEKPSSLPVVNLSNRFGLTIDVPPPPQASPQLTHLPVTMQGHPVATSADGMYAYPTSFPQHPHGLAVHTNSPSSPRGGSNQQSPTHYVASMAPLYDPLTGVVYYPQMPNGMVGQMSPPGAAMYLDPNTQFFVQQMQAVPGVSPRAAAAGAFPYQGSAYAFPNSYSQATAPEGPNSFEASISGTIMNHGSTSTTVTPTGSQTKKDKKEKNRGNYRCGRCGKPKVNHVCAFVDAVTVSQAVQTNIAILNPVTRQPYTNDRIITVNAKRKSIHDDSITARDVETFKSLGMKTASDSFTLGSKTQFNSSSSALGSLSTKSGGSLLGESLFVRTGTYDSLSRSGDEVPMRELEVPLHTARSPVGSSASNKSFKHSVAFGEEDSGHSPELGKEQSKPAGTPRGVVLGLLSCASDEAEDAFFPTEYPPNSNPKDRDGLDSSRNSSSSVFSNNGNESDASSNGDAIPAATARPTKLGSLFSTDLGLSKFFQF
eukprot:gene19753-22458_t